MSTYIIGYDIHPSKGETYDDLTSAIKKIGAYWHHLDSTWIVTTEKSAKEIRDDLKAYLNKDDQLLVVKSGTEGAWFGFNDTGSDWLRDHL
jgi:hypothetical protein